MKLGEVGSASMFFDNPTGGPMGENEKTGDRACRDKSHRVRMTDRSYSSRGKQQQHVS